MEDYKDLVQNLKQIKEQGYILTHRAGPTGIGKTLEDLLGIRENNVPGPNSHMLELKSARKNSQSMVTLFTKNPSPRGTNTKLRARFGYIIEDIKELHTTVNAVNYNTIHGQKAFKIDINTGLQRLETKYFGDSGIWGYWEKDSLRKQFEKKYPRGLLYIKADSRGENKGEEFYFNEAWLLSDFGFENFIDVIVRGEILVDIRLGRWPNGKPHDHGTGFRMYERNFDLCFQNRIRLI